MDLEARAHWVDYAEAKDEMFAFTDIKEAPWNVLDANNKKEARLNVISHLLEQIPYEEVPHEDIELPPRQERAYKRPPIDSQTWVPRVYTVTTVKAEASNGKVAPAKREARRGQTGDDFIRRGGRDVERGDRKSALERRLDDDAPEGSESPRDEQSALWHVQASGSRAANEAGIKFIT